MGSFAQGLRACGSQQDADQRPTLDSMAQMSRKTGWALVAVVMLMSLLVAAPFSPATPADAQQRIVIGDQWNQVGEQINLVVDWPTSAEVVGLPPGLVWANSAVQGSVALKGRWPVEVRFVGGTTAYFQWLITDGPPTGIVAEHLPVDPNEVSARPSEGMDGVVWNRFNNDTTASLDVTVWDMQQVGDHMYVGGEFEQVIEQDTERLTNQAYLARFDVVTGKWDPSFRPRLDGNVHALEVNSRGRLLVGGEFTNIDGQPNTEALAAINPATGQVDSSFEAWVERPFYPEGRAIIRELEIVGDFLYIGGNFSHVNGPGDTRVRVNKAARVTARYGTIDPTWNPVVSGGAVWGIGVDQDRGRVYLNGRFTSVNGSTDFSEFATVTTETGALVQGLTPRPLNQPSRPEVYDVEYFNGRVWIAGSQHTLVALDGDSHRLDFWQFAGNGCGSTFCWQGAGTGGDYQFAEKIGDFIYSGCHCTDLYDSSNRPNHYSSVTNRRTTHRVAMAYDLSGAPVATEFDLGGNIDGGWTVATDDLGCIWIGGDIIDGGFYEPGGRVFARGFARFCGEVPIPASPTGLTVVQAGADGVDLEWQPVADASGYRISRDGEEIGTIDSGAFTTYTDNNVVVGRSYEYSVRATNRVGALSEPVIVTAVVGFIDTEPPTVPSNVVAIDVGDGSVQISWDASVDDAGIMSYLVYRDGGYVGFSTSDVTTYTEVPPVGGVEYVYTVRAVDINDLRSELSDPGATVTIGGQDTEPPSVPANVNALDVGDGDGSVLVTWDGSVDNVGVRSYLIYRDGGYVGWTQAGVTEYYDSPPAEGVAYLYTVRAVDLNDLRSERSEPATVTVGGVDLEPPTVPANLVAADLGDGSVQLSWDASVDNVGMQSYLVYRNGAYVGWTPADVTTFNQVPPAQGVEYQYTVRAVDVNDLRSEASASAAITVGGADTEAPSVPANVVAADVGDGSVLVTWDASVDNIGLQSYLVYRNGAYTGWTQSDVTSFTEVPPAQGVAYAYTVRAVDVNELRSEESAAAVVSVGGVDVEAPSVPGNVAAADAGDGSVLVTWDGSVDNVGVRSYLVYRDGVYVGWTPSGVTSFSEVPPSESIEYAYSVRAVDVNDLQSARSAEATIMLGAPDVEPPSTPVNLAVANASAGATEILWDPSVDNVAVQSYLIYRDGAYLGWTPGDVTTFIDVTSVAGATYDYEVRAVDSSDNRSDKSTPFTVAIQ